MAVATEERNKIIMLGAGGVTFGGLIYWLLSKVDARRKKALRDQRRSLGGDFPHP